MLLEDIKTFLEVNVVSEPFKIDGEISGLHYGMEDCNKVIKRIMLTVDLSLKALHFATINKIGFIISYFGLIKNPIKMFNNLLVKKFTLLSRQPILIYVLGSSYIASENGISDTIIEGLHLKKEAIIKIRVNSEKFIPLGRICRPILFPNQKKYKMSDLLNKIKSLFSFPIITYWGDPNCQIKKIAIFGTDIEYQHILNLINWKEFDCIIIGNINSYDMLFFKDLKIPFISIPMCEMVELSLKKLYSILSLEFPRDEFFIFESINRQAVTDLYKKN